MANAKSKDSSKKNTVTVEKQDGSKKEVQTRNVATPNTESKPSVVSRVKDRLASAYSNVVSPSASSNPSPIKYGNVDYGNGRTDSFVDVNTDSISARPYWKQTENGQNRYVASVSKPMGGNYDTKSSESEYYSKRTTPLGTFEAGSSVEDDGAPREYWGAYTSPIRRENTNFSDGTNFSGYMYDSDGNGYANALARKVSSPNMPNEYYAISDVPFDTSRMGERSVNTPLGTFEYGSSDGDNSMYAGYTSPMGQYSEPWGESGSFYNLGNGNQLGTYNNGDGERGVYYDRNGSPYLDAYAEGYGDTSSVGLDYRSPYALNYSGDVNLPFGAGRVGLDSRDGNVQAYYQPRNGSLADRVIRAFSNRR